jgi:nicotinamidase-related amidase
MSGAPKRLISRDRSLLLLIDLQARLLPAIHQGERVVEHCVWLARIAAELGVPTLAMEQYPQGLGHLHPDLRTLLQTDQVLEKVHFGGAFESHCMERISALQRPQVVVAGTEAHVCVTQTALGLLDAGLEVFLVADAVSSRRPDDAQLAVSRLRDAGARVVSREMVAFEWLKRAGTDEFRRINRDYLR